MSNMFPPEHPASATWESRFLEVWRALNPDLRDRLRAGADRLSAEEVTQLLWSPHPLATITKWADQSGPDAWNVSPVFVDWAHDQAPAEQDL